MTLRLPRPPFGLAYSQLVMAGLGFTPILCLSLSLFGVLPLHVSLRAVIPVVAAAFVVLGLRHRELGHRVVVGLLAGMIATGVYDLARLYIAILGVWGDFIPNIGNQALASATANPFWGYLWRYLLNGGCMGMAFAALPLFGVRQGIAYGTFVCSCLFGTLLLAPDAQGALFRLTWITGAGALAGHWIYGATLGGLLRLWLAGPAVVSRREEIGIGRVDHYYPKAGVAAVRLEGHGLEAGARLLIKGRTTRIECDVPVLWDEGIPCDRAAPGSLVSFRVSEKVRPHDRVYLVKN